MENTSQALDIGSISTWHVVPSSMCTVTSIGFSACERRVCGCVGLVTYEGITGWTARARTLLASNSTMEGGNVRGRAKTSTIRRRSLRSEYLAYSSNPGVFSASMR